jgi:hypothetical protein
VTVNTALDAIAKQDVDQRRSGRGHATRRTLLVLRRMGPELAQLGRASRRTFTEALGGEAADASHRRPVTRTSHRSQRERSYITSRRIGHRGYQEQNLFWLTSRSRPEPPSRQHTSKLVGEPGRRFTFRRDCGSQPGNRFGSILRRARAAQAVASGSLANA